MNICEFKNLVENLINQIDSDDYQCCGGDLKNNAHYIRLVDALNIIDSQGVECEP